MAGRFHHGALLGGGTPSLAGVFQFSSLKGRCLTECRHPAAYLLRHYRRGPGPPAALALAALVALHPSWVPPVMASLAGGLGR